MYANGLLLGLAALQFLVIFLAGIREGWVSALGVLIFGGLLVGHWRTLWCGTGLTLRPDGIEAAKSAGTMTIPWAALGITQPGRGDAWWQIKLAYVRPHLVTTTGWISVRDVVVFEGVDPDLVAKAIATYAAEPDRRAAIGTREELDRLREGLPTPLRGIREPVEPASVRTTVQRVVLGVVLLAVSGLVGFGGDEGWRMLVLPLSWIGARRLYLAYAGWRASRRESS
ncbi:hypothetical protein ACFQX7_24715 [Luedemannella flava]